MKKSPTTRVLELFFELLEQGMKGDNEAWQLAVGLRQLLPDDVVEYEYELRKQGVA